MEQNAQKERGEDPGDQKSLYGISRQKEKDREGLKQCDLDIYKAKTSVWWARAAAERPPWAVL